MPARKHCREPVLYLVEGVLGGRPSDRSSNRFRVWNQIPGNVRGQIVQLALDEPELSPRELATRFTDTKHYFVSEASVYRLLSEHDLIAGPAYIVAKRSIPMDSRFPRLRSAGHAINAESAQMVPVSG
jgi:hypothetical protein